MAITPRAAGASFDVLLAFSLDEEANKRVNAGLSTLNDELARIQKEAAGVGETYEKSGEKVEKASKDISRELQKEARLIKQEAAALIDEVRTAQIKALKDVSGAVGDLSGKALLTGTAIVGGIFAEVQNYVNNAEEATAATTAWKRETDSLAASRARVDQVLLRESLPLLQQAARVANQASRFIERNPEIVSAALKTGVVLAGLGAVGMLVSRGIKLVADVAYLATIPAQLQAAQLQSLAGDKQLAAARMQVGGSKAPGGGGGLIGKVGLAGLGLSAGIGVIAATDKALMSVSERLYEMGGIARVVGQGIATTRGGIFPLIKDLLGLGQQAKDTSSEIKQATGLLAGSEHEAAVVEAFTSWKEDDARLIKEAAEERKEIIAEGEREIADITKKYTDQRASINAQFNESRADLIQNYHQETAQAEQDYQQSRAEAIRSGQEQLAKLAEDHQERLRQIEEGGAERLDELARSRDALGLVKEQRRIDQEREEENRAVARNREQVRRETEARLAELAVSYAQEQAQRRAQFEQALAENEAQRQEELRQAAEEHQEEIRQAREAQAQKLRDLQEGLNAERLRRREVFIATIRDLDASLLGERKLKQNYYNLMLRDAEAWLRSYRAALGGGSSLSTATGTAGGFPIRDSGGYADRGIYRLAWDRAREFVLSGQTTQAAEKIIGGNLTQDNLMRALSAGSARNVNYVDNRRMERALGKDDRQAFQRAAEEALLFALGR